MALVRERVLPWYKGKEREMGKTSFFSLTNAGIYPHCLLTAYKSLCHLPVLAGTSDYKNSDPYYCLATLLQMVQ